jgi:hypothetical protein
MKLYCNNCFSKTEYKFSKPKFCPECGLKTSTLVVPPTVSAENNELKNIQKIKDLENQLLEFNKAAPGLKKTVNSSARDVEALGVEFDEDYGTEDHSETQRHIDNFKRNANRSGVTIQKNSADSGISFGRLIENCSNSKPESDKDFQIRNDDGYVRKTNEQILEEIRLEASSVSRTIEIN